MGAIIVGSIAIGAVLYYGLLPWVYGVSPDAAAESYFSDMTAIAIAIPWLAAMFAFVQWADAKLSGRRTEPSQGGKLQKRGMPGVGVVAMLAVALAATAALKSLSGIFSA